MKYTKYILLTLGSILGTCTIGFTQAEIEFNSTGDEPQLELIETTDNGLGRLFFKNSNALDDKWALSGKLGTDPGEHQFGLYYNGSRRWVYDEPASQFQLEGSQLINGLTSNNQMILTSNLLSAKDENDVTLFQLGDLPFGGYEGELRLNYEDASAQKSGVFIKAVDGEGGALTLYNGAGFERAFLKAGPENDNEARLHLEGVSQSGGLGADGIARHLIALTNDKSSIGVSDDETFYIGIWDDVINTMPLVSEEAISFAFKTGGDDPTNSDVIAKIDQNGNFETISDLRLKDNVQSLDRVLNKVLSLNPSTYHYKKDVNQQNQIGFIAQDIQKHFPALTSGDDSSEGQYMTMNYQGMIPVLTKAIQEQHEIIEMLQKEIQAIKEDLNNFKPSKNN